MSWIERWPIPAWLGYLLLMALSVTGTYALTRVAGWATPAAYVILLGAQVIYPLALAHYANHVARGSLTRFRPLLPPAADERALVAQLTTVRTRGTWIAAVVGVVVGASSIAAFSEQEYTRFGGNAATAPFVAIAFGLSGITFAVTLYRLARQVRTVVRLHESARRVDPLRPHAAHAFARLTAVLGLGLVIVVFAWSAVDVEQQLANPSFVFASVSTIAFGVFVFVAPLWGMHQRLAAGRSQMLDEVTERLEVVTAEIHKRVASFDFHDADALSKMAATLSAERDLLHRTSTWPWEAGTLSGFATALGAPIALFLLTRLLGRFL